MQPQGSQIKLIEKVDFLTEGAMLDQQLQDISNLIPASTKNKNEQCEEELNPKRKKMKVTDSNGNKENIPNDDTLEDNAVDEENDLNLLPLSILKSILSEVKEIKREQNKILHKITDLEKKKKSSKNLLQTVRQMNLPVGTVEQFQTLIKDEKTLSILEQYFVLLGGLNISNALDGFLKATVTDKLIQTSFTWKEGEKKIRFRETPLSLLYYGMPHPLDQSGKILLLGRHFLTSDLRALRQIEQFKNTSVKEYETEMAKIIKNARQRHYMVQHRVVQVSALQRSQVEEKLAANYATAGTSNQK